MSCLLAGRQGMPKMLRLGLCVGNVKESIDQWSQFSAFGLPLSPPFIAQQPERQTQRFHEGIYRNQTPAHSPASGFLALRSDQSRLRKMYTLMMYKHGATMPVAVSLPEYPSTASEGAGSLSSFFICS